MNAALLEKLVVAYLEAHPELIEKLVTVLMDRLLKHLTDNVAAA